MASSDHHKDLTPQFFSWKVSNSIGLAEKYFATGVDRPDESNRLVEDFWNRYGGFFKLEEKFGRTRYVFAPDNPHYAFNADDNRLLLLIEVEELSTSLKAFLPKATILAHDGAEIYYDRLFSAAQTREKKYIAGPLLHTLQVRGIKNFLETQAGDLSDHIKPEAIPVHEETAPNDSAAQAAPTRTSIFSLFQKAAAPASTPEIILEKKRAAWQAAQEEAGPNPPNQYNIWDKLKCFKGLELPFNFATPAGKLIEEFYKNYEGKKNFLDKGLMQGITPTMSEQEFVRFATPIILEYRKEEFLATLDENFLRQATCMVIKKDFTQIATNVSQYIDHGCEALLIGLERIEAERKPQETITAQNKKAAQASAANTPNWPLVYWRYPMV
ncbi:MAG: hypothetical protein ACOYK8_01555 [Alphaproteobacteria bacterium]